MTPSSCYWSWTGRVEWTETNIYQDVHGPGLEVVGLCAALLPRDVYEAWDSIACRLLIALALALALAAVVVPQDLLSTRACQQKMVIHDRHTRLCMPYDELMTRAACCSARPTSISSSLP
jgi:hypothetical protein